MTVQDREIAKMTESGIGRAHSPGRRGTGGTTKSAPTHDQIADRARAIWQSKGWPAGRDEENWREAEAQLRAEANAP